MNNIKIVRLTDKCPFGQLSCELILFHQRFQGLVIGNQNKWAYK
jgi:hypothetical protein